MRHTKTLLIFAALSWLLGETLRAQNGQDPIAVAIDRDGDGLISADELRHAATAIRGLDKNSDSIVSRDEVRSSKTSTSIRGESRGSGLGGYTTPPPANDVPDHPFNIILGRATDCSVTVRLLLHDNAQAYLSYGSEKSRLSNRTPVQEFKAGQPRDFVIDSLRKNTRYYYRMSYNAGGGKAKQSDLYTFHTQRDRDAPFVFTVQADSHLDENTSGGVYLRTLANALADQPDLHFALGDTFMTGKYVRPELSHPQYLAQRYYLGHLCHSAALCFALGNHDGEIGNRGSNVWATITRQRYFPNPFPDDFFSGNEQREHEVGLPENYYQFEWGDCQFIDDSTWSNAKEYSEETVGPKEPFFEHDFEGAKFIWSDDVLLDNIVIFRKTIKSPPDGKERPDFSNLTNVVPENPRRGAGGKQGGGPGGRGRGGQQRGDPQRQR